jgi:hypothetical protein
MTILDSIKPPDVPVERIPVEPPVVRITAPEPLRVTVVDFDISFGQMVWLMIKMAIAAIPAAIFLMVLGFILAAILAAFGVFAGLAR